MSSLHFSSLIDGLKILCWHVDINWIIIDESAECRVLIMSERANLTGHNGVDSIQRGDDATAYQPLTGSCKACSSTFNDIRRPVYYYYNLYRCYSTIRVTKEDTVFSTCLSSIAHHLSLQPDLSATPQQARKASILLLLNPLTQCLSRYII